jgi:hypothetical protein
MLKMACTDGQRGSMLGFLGCSGFAVARAVVQGASAVPGVGTGGQRVLTTNLAVRVPVGAADRGAAGGADRRRDGEHSEASDRLSGRRLLNGGVPMAEVDQKLRDGT